MNRDTGLPNDGEVEKAIRALNGSILRDRTLDVNYARPRPKTPSSLGERGPRRRGRVGECFWPCAGIQGLLVQLCATPNTENRPGLLTVLRW